VVRINRIRWRPFRVPFNREFHASHGVLTEREGYLVEVRTQSGFTGLGEASPLPDYAGGSLGECGSILNGLCHALVGKDAEMVTKVGLPKGMSVSDGAARPAVGSVQCAATDALAQEGRNPFCSLLMSGSGESSAAGATSVPVNGLIGDESPQQAAEQARALITDGFDTVKVKVGRNRDRDLERISAVRDAMGESGKIRLDANGAFDERVALKRLGDFERFGVELIEQPVPPGPQAFETMGRLRSASGTPIAADESIRSIEDLHALRRAEIQNRGTHNRPDAVVVKPMLLGLADSVAIIQDCVSTRAPLKVIVATAFDAGVGTAMALHLAATIPEQHRLANGLGTLRFLESSLVQPIDVGISGGRAEARGPGLGVRLDDAAMARYATGPWIEAVA